MTPTKKVEYEEIEEEDMASALLTNFEKYCNDYKAALEEWTRERAPLEHAELALHAPRLRQAAPSATTRGRSTGHVLQKFAEIQSNI